jgi:hypothetical protein
MYLGNPMNNPSQNMYTANSSRKPEENRPTQFAIIHVRSPYTQNIQPHTIVNRTNVPLSQTTQNDITKIMTALEPSNTQYDGLKNTQNTPIINDKPKNIDENKEIINNIGLAVVGGLVGAVATTAIESLLGVHKTPKVPTPEITTEVLRMMPNLIQSLTMGMAMVATTMGLSQWLNQETPDMLKAKIDASKP